MSQINWEADKMLDVYIYDYLVKRNLQASAKAFLAEGKVSSDPVAIDTPGGFLFEWWSVFWDIFIVRAMDEKHSDVAASYIETQLIKAREQQQVQPQAQPQLQQQQQQQQPQLQMHQLIMQQQQQREDAHLLNGTPNGLVSVEPLLKQAEGANALVTKMYEERLKLPMQRDPLDDASMEQRFGNNVSQLSYPNHASMLKSQPTRQVLDGAAVGMSAALQQVHLRNQQLPVPTPDIKVEMNAILSSGAAGPDGSLIGVSGVSQGGNNLTLKGWPLTAHPTLGSALAWCLGFFRKSQKPPKDGDMDKYDLTQSLILD